ncbi:tRNA (adenosine(37)-N6)-threonylcarbamoyltransferase complex dimerization subunit type 1 TsaB [Bacteroidota bacterium]|nr:tRNA (adenosine(37)-N6)-threonylcarbamoyltransferase complex dimerization subunit type 1 TsaB [Bacteroidota bacterium]
MILLIESSAEYPSVALVTEAGVLVHLEVGKEVQSHAELLPMMVQRAVEMARNPGAGIEDAIKSHGALGADAVADSARDTAADSGIGICTKGISAVGFHEGPGSYTGLRIGVSLAKGLCYAMAVPLISVSGFEALGAEVLRSNESIDGVWVMMDARRDEVYAIKLERDGLEGSDSGYEVRVQICAMILPNPRLGDPVDSTCFVGNANEKIARLVANDGSKFIELSPRADHLSHLVVSKFQANNFEDLAYYEPYYLKDFVVGIGKKLGI